MIRPTKFSNPNQTLIAAAYILLERLRKRRIDRYDKLRTHLARKAKGCDSLFVPALSFLFLLGLIEYHPKNDSFEFIG